MKKNGPLHLYRHRTELRPAHRRAAGKGEVMTYRYFAGPRGGAKEIDPAQLDRFYKVVQNLTGLDRAVAEPILHHCGRIDHPDFDLICEKINPFQPARIVVP